MSRRAPLAALALAAAVLGCPSPLWPFGAQRVVDVGIAPPDPADAGQAQPPPAPGRVVLVIPPALEQLVYVHHDTRWRRTFRIHLGTYLRAALAQVAARRFRASRVASSLHQVALVPEDASLILVPELGPVDLQTPHLRAGEDAVFQVRMQLRVLYSTRRDAAILYATGSARGPFGAGGAHTPDLVRSALQEMLRELERELARTAQEL